MTKDEMRSLVQKQLEAYNSRSLSAFCEYFHTEVVVVRLTPETSMPSVIEFRGMEEFRQRYSVLFESSPDLHCELRSRIVLQSTVIDEEWITGAAKYPQGLHAVAIYAFRDGLIDRVWFPS